MEPKTIGVILLVSLLSFSLLPTNVAAEGFLSDILDRIREWFEMSPFGGIFTQPVKRTGEMRLTFYPETFSTKIGSHVNITSNTTGIWNFKGEMGIVMVNNMMVLKEEGTNLLIEQRIGDIVIENLEIPTLELTGMKLVLETGNWTQTSEDGSVNVKDFFGNAYIDRGVIRLEGNVSKLDRT